MNKTEIVNKVSRKFHKIGFSFKKHSPEILIAAGVAGVVTSAVMACKATTKIDAILSDTKENIEKTKEYVEEYGYSEKYTEEDHKKDMAIFYGRASIELVKLYAPSVILGVASITSIVASHRILSKRNVALAAAYTAVDKGFKEYRNRVIDRFGEELDKELKYDIKAKEVTKTVVDEETGEEKTETTIVSEANPNAHSPYTKCFDEYCEGWTKSADYNLAFLTLQQNHANDILKRRGYLTLNEVYKMLGFRPTAAGQVVGWVYDEKNPIGDNYVDFGIYNIKDESSRLFVNGHERSVWLDFNVDGNILDYIK